MKIQKLEAVNMKKNKKILTGGYPENDADVVVNISLRGRSLHLSTASRHDSPLDTSIELTDTERKLIKKMQ